KGSRKQGEIKYEVSSGNVFADLGFEDAAQELLKVDLAWQIRQLIKQKKLTQVRAAKILGIDQPRVSALTKGRIELFSVEKLMHFLNILDQDIQIVIKPKPRNRKKAGLAISFPCNVPLAAKGYHC